MAIVMCSNAKNAQFCFMAFHIVSERTRFLIHTHISVLVISRFCRDVMLIPLFIQLSNSVDIMRLNVFICFLASSSRLAWIVVQTTVLFLFVVISSVY